MTHGEKGSSVRSVDAKDTHSAADIATSNATDVKDVGSVSFKDIGEVNTVDILF